MRTCFRLLAVAGIVGSLLSSTALAQTGAPDSTTYVLRDFSTTQEGCFEPCMCPILALFLGGTFDLISTGPDAGFETFAVENVDWIATVGGPVAQQVSGGGTYRISAEQQRLVLDLRFDGGPVEHYDSGLVAVGDDFPRIDVLASVGDLFCYDEVVDIRAAPLDPGYPHLAVDRSTLYWSVSPGSGGYDVVLGDLTGLRDGLGDFVTSTHECLGDGVEPPVLDQALALYPGEGVWFLVRPAPGGTYDSNALSHQARPRDEEIDAAPTSCP